MHAARSTLWMAGIVAGALAACNGAPVDSNAPPPPPPVAVASVVVTPSLDSVNIGQALQFTAETRDANNAVLTGRTVTWESNATGTASVSASGLARGVAPGTATIKATSEGVSGSSTIKVSAIAVAAVASVTVTPSSDSVDIGQTLQFTAVTRDSNNAILNGRTVSWGSNATGTATVTVSGQARGVAAGTATITATSEGKSGSATIKVNVIAGSNAECATPQAGWLWCDDFEVSRFTSYFEYDSAGGNFSRQAGVGHNGSYGMRVKFDQGMVSAGSLHLAFGKVPAGSGLRNVDNTTNVYKELYYRTYVRNEATWTGGGADKLMRATGIVTSAWAQTIVAPVWTDPPPNENYLEVDPYTGTDTAGNLVSTKYNDFANVRFLGLSRATTPIFDAAHVGQWYCVEARVKLNDAGQSNGLFQLWINGNLEAQRTGLNWLGNYSAYGINAVFYENYWNAGSPKLQYRFLDRLVVSTQPIGC
jgi:hypothetical protein